MLTTGRTVTIEHVLPLRPLRALARLSGSQGCLVHTGFSYLSGNQKRPRMHGGFLEACPEQTVIYIELGPKGMGAWLHAEHEVSAMVGVNGDFGEGSFAVPIAPLRSRDLPARTSHMIVADDEGSLVCWFADAGRVGEAVEVPLDAHRCSVPPRPEGYYEGFLEALGRVQTVTEPAALTGGNLKGRIADASRDLRASLEGFPRIEPRCDGSFWAIDAGCEGGHLWATGEVFPHKPQSHQGITSEWAPIAAPEAEPRKAEAPREVRSSTPIAATEAEPRKAEAPREVRSSTSIKAHAGKRPVSEKRPQWTCWAWDGTTLTYEVRNYNRAATAQEHGARYARWMGGKDCKRSGVVRGGGDAALDQAIMAAVC